jgi:hypothetical protein
LIPSTAHHQARALLERYAVVAAAGVEPALRLPGSRF